MDEVAGGAVPGPDGGRGLDGNVDQAELHQAGPAGPTERGRSGGRFAHRIPPGPESWVMGSRRRGRTARDPVSQAAWPLARQFPQPKPTADALGRRGGRGLPGSPRWLGLLAWVPGGSSGGSRCGVGRWPAPDPDKRRTKAATPAAPASSRGAGDGAQLRATLDQAPHFITALAGLGTAYLQQKRYPEAIKGLRENPETLARDPPKTSS
jgi:hypothetical protein